MPNDNLEKGEAMNNEPATKHVPYGVEKTPCWPNEWYGGPYYENGQRRSNATCYYHRTEKEARDYAKHMNAHVAALEKESNAKR